MILMTSLMSVWMMEFITDGVMVTIPWNRNVPIITLGIEALFTEAPPIRIADTAGSAILNGDMYSWMNPKACSYTRMPIAPSQVDITTERILILSTLIPPALANVGFDPTAVIAVPVFV